MDILSFPDRRHTCHRAHPRRRHRRSLDHRYNNSSGGRVGYRRVLGRGRLPDWVKTGPLERASLTERADAACRTPPVFQVRVHSGAATTRGYPRLRMALDGGVRDVGRPASPGVSEHWAVDRETGASQRIGFDRAPGWVIWVFAVGYQLALVTVVAAVIAECSAWSRAGVLAGGFGCRGGGCGWLL